MNKAKTWTLTAEEDWAVDFLMKDFVCQNIREATHMWICADWRWKEIPKKYLEGKKILTTVHHIVPFKFGDAEEKDFIERDKITDAYHCSSEHTLKQIRHLTDKSIHVRPFWRDPKVFYPKNVSSLRKRIAKQVGVNNPFIVGSFQRDSEGNSIGVGKAPQPKIEKGPLEFVLYCKELKKEKPNLVVLLGGWRRQFVELKLSEFGIPFINNSDLFVGDRRGIVSEEALNYCYNALDLYVVSSRWEGGPMSEIESALTKTPIISTDVGCANQILSSESLAHINPSDDSPEEIVEKLMNCVPNVDYAYEKVQEYALPGGLKWFEDLLESL